MGGILSGIFTATESSAIAVIYTVLVGVVVYRSLGWSEFWAAARQSVRTASMVLFIIAAATAFGFALALLEVPAALGELIGIVTQNPLLTLLIIITTPIFLPIAKSFGIDPVHFGVIMILNLGIGLNTPPLGPVQFVAAAVGKISVWEAMRSIWPFYLAGIVVLGLVTYIPALSLWLPRMMAS